MIGMFLGIILNVLVLYDTNNNGMLEGVDAGKIVVAKKENLYRFGVTNQNSATSIDLESGLWKVSSEFDSSIPLISWLCEDYVEIGQENKTVVLVCERVFRFRIPFLEK